MSLFLWFAWSPLLVVLCASFCMVLIWTLLLHASCRTVAFVGCTVCLSLVLCVFVSLFPLFRTVAFIGCTVCIFLYGPYLDAFTACVFVARSPLLVVLCVFLFYVLVFSLICMVAFIGCTVLIFLHGPNLGVFYRMFLVFISVSLASFISLFIL